MLLSLKSKESPFFVHYSLSLWIECIMQKLLYFFYELSCELSVCATQFVCACAVCICVWLNRLCLSKLLLLLTFSCFVFCSFVSLVSAIWCTTYFTNTYTYLHIHINARYNDTHVHMPQTSQTYTHTCAHIQSLTYDRCETLCSSHRSMAFKITTINYLECDLHFFEETWS